MATSDCGPIFTGYKRTPFMYVGDTYDVPNSPYSIKVLSMDCDSVTIPPEFSNTIRVLKDGIAIGDNTCHPFIDGSCPTLLDNNNVCISNGWMDCQIPNNCQYDIWYNEVTITTHVLDLTIGTYSWYTPQGAVDYLVTNLVGINGAIVNWLTSFTGWTFIYTEIINDGPNVIIRIHLNDGSIIPAPTPVPTPASSILTTSNIQTLAVQLGIVEIGLIMATLGVIFITVGIPIAIALKNIFSGTQDAAKQFTPNDVVNMVITDPDSIVAKQLKNCDLNFPSDAAGLKLCYDSVIKGAQDGLANKLNLPPPTINVSTETQKCLDQYLIDSNWTNYQTCLLAVQLVAGGELLDAVTCLSGEYYDITQGKCVTTDTEDCWISSPAGGCILTSSTGKTIAIIGVVAISGYLLFRLIKR